MTQINRANVASLAPRWLFQHGVIDGVSNQTTPVIVDGTMYVTDSRGSVYALDAADGHLLWTYDVTSLLGGGAREGYVFRHRGVVYANGVVYTAAGSFLFALDAKTGKPLQRFGNNGQASVILDVLKRAISGREERRSASATGSRPRRRFTTACCTSAARGARATFPAVTCWRSTRKRARSCGTSTPSRRTKKIRAGTWPDRPGWAASATAAASGKRRQSIPRWACSTSPWAIRSATARSARARTSSPTRSSR